MLLKISSKETPYERQIFSIFENILFVAKSICGQIYLWPNLFVGKCHEYMASTCEYKGKNMCASSYPYYYNYEEVCRTMQQVKKAHFEQTPHILRDKQVLDATECCLKRIVFVANENHFLEKHSRIFLAGFMIVYHPTEVFGHSADSLLEKEVLKRMRAVVKAFKKLCKEDGMDSSKSSKTAKSNKKEGMAKKFCILFLDYVQVFKSWSVPDDDKLLEKLKNAILVLYRAKKIHDDHVFDMNNTQTLHDVIQFEIERLRMKAKEIGGNMKLQRMDEAIAKELAQK